MLNVKNEVFCIIKEDMEMFLLFISRLPDLKSVIMLGETHKP